MKQNDIVTIIGSTKYVFDMTLIAEYLYNNGLIVFTPLKVVNHEPNISRIKTAYFTKIKMADYIVVFDFNMGNDTLEELNLSKSLGKPILYVSENYKKFITNKTREEWV